VAVQAHVGKLAQQGHKLLGFVCVDLPVFDSLEKLVPDVFDVVGRVVEPNAVGLERFQQLQRFGQIDGLVLQCLAAHLAQGAAAG
jgi:hypothetical protein